MASKPKLSASLVNALKEQNLTVDSASLLRELIDIWGGPRKLALDLFNEFQRAQAGGQNRQRILEMIQRLIVTCTNDDLNRPADPSEMDDDELDAVALKYVERLSDGKEEASRRRRPSAAVERDERAEVDPEDDPFDDASFD